MAHNSDIEEKTIERDGGKVSVQLFMAHNSDNSLAWTRQLHLVSQCNFSWHIILIKCQRPEWCDLGVSVQLFMAHNSDFVFLEQVYLHNGLSATFHGT